MDRYNVLNLRLGVRLGAAPIVNRLTLECAVNNVTNELYSGSGYTYFGVPYTLPAAERNVFVRLRTEW